MKVLKKIIVIVSFVTTFTNQVFGEKPWRLRYSVPISGENEIKRGTSESSEKFSTNGDSGYLIFPNGIGFGYNSVLIIGEITGIQYNFKNHNFDLSYTIGDHLSFSLGVGKLIYGRSEQEVNKEKYLTESSIGNSVFVNLGIPIMGLEFLLGYRQNKIKYRNFQRRISGNSEVLGESIELISSQISTGFGILF